jgi:hypothetical protein
MLWPSRIDGTRSLFFAYITKGTLHYGRLTYGLIGPRTCRPSRLFCETNRNRLNLLNLQLLPMLHELASAAASAAIILLVRVNALLFSI